MTLTQEQVLADLRADFDALEQITSLVYELYSRVTLMEDASGPVELGARAALAHGVNVRLHELGVDLGLPDLSSLLASTVASTPASSGTVEPQTPEHPEPSDAPTVITVPLEPTDAGFPDQPEEDAAEELVEEDEHGNVYDPNWKPGDPCSACESTNTGRASNGSAYCLDCGARDVDEDHEG